MAASWRSGGNVMKLVISIAALLVAAVGHVDAQTPIDDLTPCSMAVRAFASKIREVEAFMDSTFERLDQDHKKYGEPGILNDGLKRTLEAAAAGFCTQHPHSTISNEAAETYRYLRALSVRGVEP
jgi:hypothetical protein